MFSYDTAKLLDKKPLNILHRRLDSPRLKPHIQQKKALETLQNLLINIPIHDANVAIVPG